ncbi:MAG TPA: TlpA disulfide reductase family protein [Kofleriaceae bacterium]|jgi:thiol-disulfide isomerase/thioredoxin
MLSLRPRVLVAGGLVAAVGVAVLAVFLWMVPQAAAREAVSACKGLKGEATLNASVCGGKDPCPIGTLAPDFAAKDVTGKVVHLSDYRGKIVLLNFWASWCGVCKTEKPELSAMAKDLAGKDFVIVALASDHSFSDALVGVLDALAPTAKLPDVRGEIPLSDVKRVYDQALPHGIPFNVLLDPPEGDGNIGKIAAQWGITAVPESALIGRDGKIIAYFANKRDWSLPVAETCLRSVVESSGSH